VTTTIAQNDKVAPQNVYIAISGCRSLSQSPGNSFFEFGVIENCRCVVGISMMSHSFRDISISGFGSHFRLSVIIGIAVVKTQVCRWNFDDTFQLSSSGNFDFVGRWCVLEIHDDSRITGSTHSFAGFTETHVVPKTIHGFMIMYETSTPAMSNHGRHYLVSKIQDGSQLTGSSSIYETMKHIIKMPTATPTFSGSSFLVVVLPISWDVDVCYKSKM